MPESRSSLVICVTGAECTGKTTLAGRLAEALGVPWVAEAARDYLAGRNGYVPDDLLAIAAAQEARERAALAQAPLVVADTDLTVIRVWWQEKYGALPAELEDLLARRSPRRYLLPRPDLPWVSDPLRESPNDRPRLHRRYRAVLAADPFPFAEVWGFGDERHARALRQVRDWLDA